MCNDCGKQFQNKKRPLKLQNIIWNEYVWGKQTLLQLSKKYKKSKTWIKKQLEITEIVEKIIKPQSVVLIADVTFFKRAFGIIVFRAPQLEENIYFKEVGSEKVDEYRQGKEYLEHQGFTIKAIVLDGKPGIRSVFSDIPVQMCHFHQKAILNRYLTRRPKLQASIELREITFDLCRINEIDFSKRLDLWHEKWKDFLKDRTTDPITGRWHYTHKRIRTAYRSLKINLPYLFTYQKYPELNIPNTTNSLDGSFAHLKSLLRIHRGIKKDLKIKIIQEILGK